jgi:excisionase family DNA binding protein
MSVKRHTVTTIESHEFWIVRRPEEGSQEILCDRCSGVSEMLTPQQAAEQAGVSQRTVFRWIDEGVVHFAETAEGMFVCLAPLTIDAG